MRQYTFFYSVFSFSRSHTPMMFKGVTVPAIGSQLTFAGLRTYKPSFPFSFTDARGKTVNLRASAVMKALGQTNNGEVLFYGGIFVTVGKVYTRLRGRGGVCPRATDSSHAVTAPGNVRSCSQAMQPLP